MPDPSILLISILRALVEVAMMSLLGQGLLALLVGQKRDGNVIYQLFSVVTRPVIYMIRAVTPKVVIDKHLPVLSFFVLFWLWILLAYIKRMM